MADFNQKKAGEKLSDISAKSREQLITRNTYKSNNTYNANHPNALADGGRIGNVKNNLYNKSNEYSAGNMDTGNGYTPTVTEPR